MTDKLSRRYFSKALTLGIVALAAGVRAAGAVEERFAERKALVTRLGGKFVRMDYYGLVHVKVAD